MASVGWGTRLHSVRACQEYSEPLSGMSSFYLSLLVLTMPVTRPFLRSATHEGSSGAENDPPGIGLILLTNEGQKGCKSVILGVESGGGVYGVRMWGLRQIT